MLARFRYQIENTQQINIQTNSYILIEETQEHTKLYICFIRTHG